MAWPVQIAGDKGYRAAWIDEYLLELGVVPVIPNKTNEDRKARPVAFDKAAYRRRTIVECLIGWLKESRRIITRFDKTAINFTQGSGKSLTMLWLSLKPRPKKK